jgi:acyl carrier protein
MRRFTEVDERVYEAAMRYRDNARELLDPALRANGQAPPKSKPAVPPTTSPTTTNNTELRHLVAKSLGVSDDLVLDASSLRDLGVNSLDLVVLVMSIEEHFHIEFEPSDLERLRTFADLAHRVVELTARR